MDTERRLAEVPRGHGPSRRKLTVARHGVQVRKRTTTYGDPDKNRTLERALGLSRDQDGLLPGNDGTMANLGLREVMGRRAAETEGLLGKTAREGPYAQYYLDPADGMIKVRHFPKGTTDIPREAAQDAPQT